MPGTNIFGPHGPGINETTTRPAQTDSDSSTDSWFGPCVDNDPNTGTKISYRWLNFVTANLREAVRGMGVPENETDDELLLKCFLALQSNFSLTALMNLPFFPEVQNVNGALTFTTSTGQVVVNTGHTFLHRGHKLYSTSSDFDAAARTFATAANKTYHLRWYPPGHANANPGTYPKGRFMLRDLADSGYNPGAGAETLIGFDTAYDDMLVAKVVTNGSNVPTVTALKNKHSMFLQELIAGSSYANAGLNTAQCLMTSTAYNWARTPAAFSTPIIQMTCNVGNADRDFAIVSAGDTPGIANPNYNALTRYQWQGRAMWDGSSSMTCHFSASA